MAKKQTANKHFNYVALDNNGKEVRGIIDAVDDVDAGIELKNLGYFPITITEQAPEASSTLPTMQKKKEKPKGLIAKLQSIQLGGKKINTKMLCMFTRQLAIMLDAGLPLLTAVRTLHEQCGKNRKLKVFKEIIGDVADYVEEGLPLSEALAEHKKSFNHLYVSMIKAGEASGSMEAVLNRLADYMEKAEKLKRKVKAGMAYPVVVLVIALTITTGLMIFVVPKFAEMFEELLAGRPLPVLTEFVIGISDFMMNNVLLIFGGIFVFVIVFRFVKKTKKGSYILDLLSLKMPPINGLVIKVNVARFCSTLGTLLNSGVPVLDALRIVRDTSGNAVMRDTVEVLYGAVSEGENFSKPLEKNSIFPLMVVRMIAVGEQTGALPDMLTRIAITFEEEVESTVDALVSLIEPLMIVFLAVVVGGIVLALFMPLIAIIESLGG